MGLIGQNLREFRQTAIANAKTSDATGWDLAELLERLDHDRDFLCELLNIFREDCAMNLKRARAALASRDLVEVMRAAHTIKGMMRNLSMHQAGELACALETLAREEKGEEASAALMELEKAFAELLPEVEAQLAGVKT